MSILEPESAIWYSLCWMVIVTRLISRRLHLGRWRNLQLDDYLIVAAMVCFQAYLYMAVVTVASAHRYHPYGVHALHHHYQQQPHRSHRRRHKVLSRRDSRSCLWLEACLGGRADADRDSLANKIMPTVVIQQDDVSDIDDNLLTTTDIVFRVLLPHQKLVTATAIYVGVSFVAMEILYFGVWCRYERLVTNRTCCCRICLRHRLSRQRTFIPHLHMN